MSTRQHTSERWRTPRRVPPFRDVRLARGLTLREVSRQTGIDPAHLSKVERGMAGLSVDRLSRLAGVLGLGDLSAALAPVVPPRESV